MNLKCTEVFNKLYCARVITMERITDKWDSVLHLLDLTNEIFYKDVMVSTKKK